MSELFARKDASRFESIIQRSSGQLSPEDEGALWRTVITHVLGDAYYLCHAAKARYPVFLEIGRCSHWLCPHHYRWPADGSFAVPVGYGGHGYSITGLPEFDWSLTWKWDCITRCWLAHSGDLPRRALRLRVAVPSRTTRHNQAAVHTLWTPGSPVNRKLKRRQFYGFRKRAGEWRETAYLGGNRQGVPDEYDRLAGHSGTNCLQQFIEDSQGETSETNKTAPVC